jgi:hypothetical protein
LRKEPVGWIVAFRSAKVALRLAQLWTIPSALLSRSERRLSGCHGHACVAMFAGGQKVGLKIAHAAAIFTLMVTQSKSPTNEQKVSQLRAAMAEMLVEILRRGFHGTAGIELRVQDGTIQNIRRRIERIER